MYYVGSRYYDPEVGSFVNPDTTDILGADSELYDKNLYAYCDNNPVMRMDSDGELWIAALAAGAVVGVVSQYVSNVVGGLLDGKSLGSAMKIGREDIPGLIGAALSGALMTTGISAGGLAIANAAINTTTYLAECEMTGIKLNKTELAVNVGLGMIGDARSGGGINSKRLRGVWNTSNKKIQSSKSAVRIAKYTAKKTAVKKTVRKTIGGTFRSALWSNNRQKIYIWLWNR